MVRHGLPADKWKKSTYSEGAGNECVETQPTGDGCVGLGDSKSRSRGALILGQPAWYQFIAAVRTGTLRR